MQPKKYSNTNILIVAFFGICLVLFSVFVAAMSDTRQQSKATVINLQSSSRQTYQPTAQTVLSCADYDTLYGANYNQLLYSSFAFITQITNRVPGQNTAFLNFQYNAAANQAYGLYTSSMNNVTCKPSISAPMAVTPASPPNNTIDPTTLGTSIPTSCAYPLALQYLANYYQQYVVNMQNEQMNLTNFINKLLPSPTQITLQLQQGVGSVQAQFNNNVQNLSQLFSGDVGNIGC
jgi:hypothetical protein